MTILRCALILFVLIAVPAVEAGELRVFDPGSMQTIEAVHSGSPFIIAVWATDCPPCRHELALLATFSDKHPRVPIVLIATDGTRNVDDVLDVLADYELDRAETWNFGPAGVDRLRYAIDPGWYGEMPRSYLYDASGNRVGISGALTADLLRDWLAN